MTYSWLLERRSPETAPSCPGYDIYQTNLFY